MTQYSQYGSVPSAVRDLILSKVSLLDEYIIMQTGQNEYSALVHNLVTKACTRYTVYRSSGMGYWYMTETADVWDYTVSNEYYVLSNCGVGTNAVPPVVQGVTAHASVVLVSVLMLYIFFGRWLFRWAKR